MTSSPAETRPINAVVMAPMPLPKTMADSAPSSRATASSAARTVGFSSREYMNSPLEPRAYSCTCAALSKRKVVDCTMGTVRGAFLPSGVPACTARVQKPGGGGGQAGFEKENKKKPPGRMPGG